MAPRKNKKKVIAAAESNSEEVVSSKRSLKRLKKAFIASESTPEEVVSDEKKVEDEKGGDAKESVPTPKVRKPCTWLKLDRINPELGSKLSLQSCEQGKEAKPTAQVKDQEGNKRKRNEKGERKGHCKPVTKEKQTARPEKKDKEDINARREETKNMDEESEKELGGLIFMCNAKTKPDCFRYQIMGVPASKKEVVMSINPGLKFFLYDYDLKVMYGVFEASSAGGMKLEPAAFGGAFPAQVRFLVHKDCLPLPESAFKKAIKDSYDQRTKKFRTELTVKQVKNLIAMFNPNPLLHPSDMHGESIPLPHEKQFSNNRAFHSTGLPRGPLFLTEQEYRSKGLQQGGRLLPTTTDDIASNAWEPTKLNVELKHLLRNPDPTRTDLPDPFFLGEKEYRTYGLKGPQQVPHNNSHNPYDEATTSLVNRYLPLPMTASVLAESYPRASREPPHISDHHHTSHTQSHPARTIPGGEKSLAPHSFREQSVFNQRSYSLNASYEPPPSELRRGFSLQHQIGLASAPVSHRYSFAGPSLSQHR